MKKLFLVLLVNLFLMFNSFGQLGIPTADVLTNTFLMITDTLSGTCFLVVQNDTEYIITAKHLFRRGIKNGDSVFFNILRAKKFGETKIEVHEPFYGKVYVHNNPNVDIAIIKIPNKLSSIKPYEFSISGSILGQDCYFFGFPYYEEKFTTTNRGEADRFAFVKKAIISAFYKDKDVDIDLLDGQNNPGFSGGPVIFYDYETKKNKILGVISGYYPQTNKAEISPSVFLNYVENSGIVFCYPSNYISDIIKRVK